MTNRLDWLAATVFRSSAPVSPSWDGGLRVAYAIVGSARLYLTVKLRDFRRGLYALSCSACIM
jgi:hypothetical protein